MTRKRGGTDWDQFAAWWRGIERADPAYDEIINPILDDLPLTDSDAVVDFGCGSGETLAYLGAPDRPTLGIDRSKTLLETVPGPTLQADLNRELPTDESFDLALCLFVIEHIENIETFFSEAGRLAGRLLLVMNHPIFTAVDSAPMSDSSGEVLWRPGKYFDQGTTQVPIQLDRPAPELIATSGDGPVASYPFRHRPLGALLTVAAQAGWNLEWADELGFTTGQLHRDPSLHTQPAVPRVLAVRWSRG